ncbi:MAG: hypothetical protein DMD87_19655 [Candidatus Rokuibacteriota bacterium]|nr:MAG: hypothetical protein DMD87_19655 [Candidatus Rokubacteria bacterium]
MTDRIARVLTMIAALALLPATSAAETYRWIDDQGNVTYSDRPPQSREVGAPETKPEPGPKAPEAKTADPIAQESKSPEAKALEPPPRTRDARAPVPPAPIHRSGPTKVDELLELSGVRVQLAGLLNRVAVDLRPPPGQMSAAEMAAIDRILAQSLRPEMVYGAMRDAFRPQVDRPNLEATAAWLRTPVARKIVALEIASSEPSADQKVADYAARVKVNPPAARRLELLQRLDWVTGANETSADLVAAIARGLSNAVSAAGPAEARLRPGQIEDRAAQVRARASESLREVRTMSMLYTYQTLEDDELSEYVRFSSSDAGRWYNTATRKALVASIGKVVEQTATELVRAVPLERWARAAMPAPQPVK